MKKQKPRTWRWVSRESGYFKALVRVWSQLEEPDFPMLNSENCVEACAKEFNLLFGVCPAPGECIKVEFQKAKVIR